nr:hypothetical protein [Tanacetum cinerariifolium]
MDEALVPSTQRLRIRRSNFRLLSDIQSKESTLQLFYDVLRRCPFFKAFLVTADVPKIYMQELWATAYVHQHSIRLKMNNKKHIVNLKSFRDMLHICPRIPGQSFDELPFKEEILDFIRFLRHSATIRTLTDGLYHKRNIDYAFLIWEDFVYQVEHKNHKNSNEMYYLRFTKVIIHRFMSKDPSISRRNKVNWHYVRYNFIFSTIKVVSRHQNTQQYDAMLPVELTNDEIRNSKAYKEYYAFATGEAASKPKASARRKKSGSDTFITPPIVVVTPKLTVAAKGKQPAKAAKAKSPSAPSEVARTEVQQLKIVLKRSRQQTHISQSGGSGTDEGTGSKPGVPDVPTDESEEELLWNSSDDEGSSDDEDDNKETRDEESFDPIPQTPEGSEDEGDGEEDQGLNIGEEERPDEEEDEDELYRDVKEQVKPQVSKILPRIKQAVNEQLEAEVLTRSSHSSRTSYVLVVDLSEMELKKILIEKMEGNKSIQRSDEQRNLYKALVDAYESDKIILKTYRESVTLKRRRDDDEDKDEEPSAGPDRGSKRPREGKEPESASTPSETATKIVGRSTTGSRSRQTSTSESAFAEEPVQTTSQMEEPSHPKFEIGADDQPIVQSSQHPEWFSQPQKPPTLDCNWNKTLPAVHGSIQPWISKLAKQADTRSSFNELLDTPLDFSNFIMNRLRVDTLTLKLLAGPTYELIKGSCTSLIELEYHLEEVYKATTDQLDWVNPKGQQYPHNLLQPLSLIPDNRGRRVIPFAHFINNDLEYLQGGASSLKYTTSVTKTKAADYEQIKWIEDLVPRTMWIQEPIDYDKIIAVTDLKIVKWHSYKHLDWITVRRDDDKLYNFKEGNFKRLRLQEIEDMLLLLVQGKLTNLTVEERVENYQKRLNLTKPDTYRSNMKRREAYSAYSNPRGFIYQNKYKKNRLMRIDELHKFSDGTLNDVRTALDDRLKGIRMQLLPQTIWRKVIRTEQQP